MYKDLIQDLKSFGGLPLLAVLILISFGLNQKALSAQLVAGLLLSYAVTVGIRLVYFKDRPKKHKSANFLQRIDASSFPSLHAMRASFLAVIFSLFFRNTVFTVLFALLALGVAWARVRQKRHFLSDVIAGLLFGILIAFISIWIVAKINIL